MSIAKPPVEARQSDRSSDDLDGLLRSFFDASMPHTWPASPIPVQTVLQLKRASSWGRRVRSALALAASLLLLALGLAFLSGKFSDQSPNHLPNGTPIGNPHPDVPHHGEIRPEK